MLVRILGAISLNVTAVAGAMSTPARAGQKAPR